MSPKEATKTILVGFLLVLGFTLAGATWGVFTGVVITVPAETAWYGLVATVLTFAAIPASCFYIEKTA